MTTTNYQLKAELKLRSYVCDELRVLYRTAFFRCGHGLNEAQFDEVVQKLHGEGFLTIGLSRKGARRLELLGCRHGE